MPRNGGDGVVQRKNRRAVFKEMQKSLLDELVAKATLVQRLQEENDLLVHQHQLLGCLCDLLAWFRDKKTFQTGVFSCTSLADDMEQQLLQQLHALPLPRSQDVGEQRTRQTTCSAGAEQQDTPRSGSIGQLTAGPVSQQQQQAATKADAAVLSADSQLNHQLAEQQSIPSPNDRLWLCKRLMSAAVGSEAVLELTLERLQAEYACLIREVALNLYRHGAQQHLMDSGLHQHQQQQKQQAAVQQSSPLQKVEELLIFHLQRLVALVAFGGSDMPHALSLSNCETGEVLPEGDAAQHKAAVASVNLSHQQLKQIVMAWPVFKRLLDAVLLEQRELQLQMHSMALSDSSSTQDSSALAHDGVSRDRVASGLCSGKVLAKCRAGIAAAAAVPGASNRDANTSCPDNASSAAQLVHSAAVADLLPAGDLDDDDSCMPKPFIHRQQLDLQQKRMSRLLLCLHKDSLIKIMSGTYLFGCMSWEQLGKLHVLMSPFLPMPAMVYQAAVALWEDQKAADKTGS